MLGLRSRVGVGLGSGIRVSGAILARCREHKTVQPVMDMVMVKVMVVVKVRVRFRAKVRVKG